MIQDFSINTKGVFHSLLILLKGRQLHSTARYMPFFIIGSGRSGSTLLRAILETNPEVHIPPETYVIGRTIKNYIRYSRLPWSILLKIILSEFEYYPEFTTFGISLRELYNKLIEINQKERNLAYILHNLYLFHAKSVLKNAKRWGDKTPMNTFYLDKIYSVFPDSFFIHIIRDGRDVVLSYMKMGRYNTMQESADRWFLSVQKAIKFGRRHPEQYIEIRYEDLVRSPKKSIQFVCDFIGLEFMDNMLRHNEMNINLGDVEVRSHHKNVKNEINVASIGKWRKQFKTKEIAWLNDRIGPLLEQLGYEI